MDWGERSLACSSLTINELPDGGYIGIIVKRERDRWNFDRVLKKGEATPPSGTDTVFIKGRVIDSTEVHVISFADFKDVSSPGWIEAHASEVNRIEMGLQSYYIMELEKDEIVYIPIYSNADRSAWNVQERKITTDLDDLKDYETDQDTAIVSARVAGFYNRYEVDVEYGVESWFVPEGEALSFERNLMGRMTVRVSVDSSGNAVINKVLVDGKPISF